MSTRGFLVYLTYGDGNNNTCLKYMEELSTRENAKIFVEGFLKRYWDGSKLSYANIAPSNDFCHKDMTNEKPYAFTKGNVDINPNCEKRYFGGIVIVE